MVLAWAMITRKWLAIALKPFREHWDAIYHLHRDIKRALNLLNGRPAEFEEPHFAPMSLGSSDASHASRHPRSDRSPP